MSNMQRRSVRACGCMRDNALLYMRYLMEMEKEAYKFEEFWYNIVRKRAK